MTQDKFLIIIKELCNRYIDEKGDSPEFMQFRQAYKKHKDTMCLSADCSVPPEYRRAGSRQEQIKETPAGDVYSLMTYIFSLVTDQKIPINFQLGKRWKPLMEKACLGWDETKKQALFRLFYKGTKINEKDRIQSIQSLTESEEYQELMADNSATMSVR